MEFRFKTGKRTTRAEGQTAQQFYNEMHGNEEYHPCKTEGDAQLLGEGKTADPPHPRHRPFKTHKL